MSGAVDGGTTWTNITGCVSGTAVSWATTLAAGDNSIKFARRHAAGNVGTIATQAYTLDTSAPTKTVSSIAISADLGSSGSDFVTSTASQTITATLSGALAAASGGASAEELWGSVGGGLNWSHITSSVSGTAVSWDTTLSSGDN